ncbi:DNA polymerase/3'-5' exonuclease PolX [Candidatus Marsarchaeota archaeon]|nr:DNA polymerase/3'-5' exonuclease PolX [Candidatus Marsarchaeota archaeon]
MENKKLADIFYEIAEYLSIDEGPTSRFESNAYEKAGLTIETLQEPIQGIYEKQGREGLMQLPGIGKGLAERIEEFIKTGRIKKYDELRKKYPVDLHSLGNIEGLGIKRAMAIYKALGVRNAEDLKKAVNEKKVRSIPGFGEKSEKLISKALKLMEARGGRILLGHALPIAEQLAFELDKTGLAKKIEISGSIRRMRETIGDIDILAISGRPEETINAFAGFDDVESVVAKGKTKVTVWLKAGISCDLRVIALESFASALQYFTGSKEHNIGVRKIAISKGYKLNEYGLFNKNDAAVKCIDEADIYSRLGMDYIPPEMREDRGEIKLAQEHKIPRLVEIGDIKGDLHTHTSDSDGQNTLEEMVGAAAKNKLEYIAITNHTKSLKVANGLDEKRFRALFRRIDLLNEKADGIRILKGAEVDILKNGGLDIDKRMLEDMDIVVGAVHSGFKMDREAMTGRIINAIESGINILAHPTGRLINRRLPYDIDFEKIFEACEKNNVALEINSFPDRLDLNDSNILLASRHKLMFAIDTDAHETEHLKFLKYGIGTAKRGWLTKNKVINAMPLNGLKKILKG